MRKEYFIETENHSYMILINGADEYPRFNFFVKDGDKWSAKLIVNDNIWDNIGNKFMGILKSHLAENDIKGYTFKVDSEQRLDVYERFLNNAGFDVVRGKVNKIIERN